MKHKLLLALFALLTTTMVWADVEINATNFPDEGFRKFLLKKKYGKDGVLTDAEIAGIKKISVRYRRSIHNLKGIEHFNALNKLHCDHTVIEELDLSKNNALTELWCGVNSQMKRLDISGCTQLRFLECVHTRLETLDVSNNIALEKLYCSGNDLTRLDVSKNTALTLLSCGSNQLTTLDVSKNTALTNLECSCNQLTTLDVSQNTVLKELTCCCNKIKGEGMDALIENLPPIAKKGKLYVLNPDNLFDEEHNELTSAQVAAVWVKRWIPFKEKLYEWKKIKKK